MDNTQSDLGGYNAIPRELDKGVTDKNAAMRMAPAKVTQKGRRSRSMAPEFPVEVRKLTQADIDQHEKDAARKTDMWERVAASMTPPPAVTSEKPATPQVRAPLPPVTGTSPFGKTPDQLARSAGTRTGRNGQKAATARELLKNAGFDVVTGEKPAKTTETDETATKRVSYGFGLSGTVTEPLTSAGLNRAYGAAKGSPKLRHGLRLDR